MKETFKRAAVIWAACTLVVALVCLMIRVDTLTRVILRIQADQIHLRRELIRLRADNTYLIEIVRHLKLDTFVCTAYEPSPRSCGKWADGMTKLGTRARKGRTIAVDPRIIPLGTYIYIQGIGWRRAEDIGGEIKGNHIDIFMGSVREALKFGVSKRRVLIVKRGGNHD